MKIGDLVKESLAELEQNRTSIIVPSFPSDRIEPGAKPVRPDVKLESRSGASIKESGGNHFKRVPLLTVDVEWTPRYCWYLIPTIEINTSVKEIAVNIFCLGIYIGWRR